MSAGGRAALALLCLWLGGCAALPWPSGRERSAAAERSGEWLDLRGAVHVHTRASHDSPGEIGALIDAAHSAGIRWIALTEHRRNARFAPAGGRIEGVRLIPGWEISAGGGSILALGIDEARGLPRDPRALVAEIHARGGAAFVGHVERSALVEPGRWDELGADGIELANLHANASAARFRLTLAGLFLPARFALRPLLAPPHGNLERWAQLPGARAIVGGVDAHQKFRLLGPLGGTADRYRDLLRLLTTHVLARDDSQAAILEALREGRSYLAFEGLAPVDRFEVEPRRDHLAVRAPRKARLALVCAGETVDEAIAAQALLHSSGATHCHVQAWLGSRLWIATSHIHAGW